MDAKAAWFARVGIFTAWLAAIYSGYSLGQDNRTLPVGIAFWTSLAALSTVALTIAKEPTT